MVRGLTGAGAGRDTAATAASVSHGEGSAWGGTGVGGDAMVCDGMEHVAQLHGMGTGGPATGAQSRTSLGGALGRFPHDLRLADVSFPPPIPILVICGLIHPHIFGISPVTALVHIPSLMGAVLST